MICDVRDDVIAAAESNDVLKSLRDSLEVSSVHCVPGRHDTRTGPPVGI
jgi:hypothetical protein